MRDDATPVNRIAEEDDELQAATLMDVPELHPTLLTEEELIREVASDPGDGAERDGAARAARELVKAGLLHRNGDLMLPTRAAVRFRELFGLIC